MHTPLSPALAKISLVENGSSPGTGTAARTLAKTQKGHPKGWHRRVKEFRRRQYGKKACKTRKRNRHNSGAFLDASDRILRFL